MELRNKAGKERSSSVTIYATRPFKSQDEAFVAIGDFLDVYHRERPHSALGYLTPEEFRLSQSQAA